MYGPGSEENMIEWMNEWVMDFMLKVGKDYMDL